MLRRQRSLGGSASVRRTGEQRAPSALRALLV